MEIIGRKLIWEQSQIVRIKELITTFANQRQKIHGLRQWTLLAIQWDTALLSIFEPMTWSKSTISCLDTEIGHLGYLWTKQATHEAKNCTEVSKADQVKNRCWWGKIWGMILPFLSGRAHWPELALSGFSRDTEFFQRCVQFYPVALESMER